MPLSITRLSVFRPVELLAPAECQRASVSSMELVPVARVT